MRNDILEILDFWFEEVGPEGWFVTSEKVDAEIRDRFSIFVTKAISGDLDSWTETPEGTLALLILLDQFPRNLHRGRADAFAGDAKARDIARLAVCQNRDMEIEEVRRRFFYLPFEHSESLADQDWSVALFKTRLTSITDLTMWHIEQHREVIKRFGRFPFRNAALGRTFTPEEQAFTDAGGYTPASKP